MDYENGFWRKEHFLTTRGRRSNSGRRRLIFNNKQLKKVFMEKFYVGGG